MKRKNRESGKGIDFLSLFRVIDFDYKVQFQGLASKFKANCIHCMAISVKADANGRGDAHCFSGSVLQFFTTYVSSFLKNPIYLHFNFGEVAQKVRAQDS